MSLILLDKHQKIRAVLVVGILMCAGLAGAILTQAATFIAYTEAESGSLSGSAGIVANGLASGGGAVRFGDALSPPPPPPPPPATGVLPIPDPLTGSWTAPSGSFSMPSDPVNIVGTASVDLSAATITGATGYLFALQSGSDLTITGGVLNGTMTGLVQADISDGTKAKVSITGTRLTNVRSVVFARSKAGAVSVTMRRVHATGLGSGQRGVADIVDIDGSTLNGGGTPPSGEPAGVHMLDDTSGNVAVPGTLMRITNSTITGYTSDGFQGDSLLGETRVESAYIVGNVLGRNKDSGGVDSKMKSVTFSNNTVYSEGNRAISSHYGRLTSTGNTMYQVARTVDNRVGRAYQGTGELIASNDKVILEPGAYLAVADVTLQPGSGPPSTYPRVGRLVITHATNDAGAVVMGPTAVHPAGGFTPTITVNP